MSRRGYCRACAGVRGRFIEHTCGIESAAHVPRKEPVVAVGNVVDVMDKANWTNGKLFPSRIPIMHLADHYKWLGYDVEQACQKLEATATFFLDANMGKRLELYERPELVPGLIRKLRECYPPAP